jgi:predicted transcriptional regulator
VVKVSKWGQMPRINIYLSADLQKRLAEYREREWGNHHSLSAIVQKAIKEFLDREEKKGRKEG